MKVEFPYGTTRLTYDFPRQELAGVLTCGLHSYAPPAPEGELVAKFGEQLLGKTAVTVTAIPDGVGVVVKGQ